jgi:hypothetical protein
VSLRITDAIDLHCHFGPDTIGGTLDGDHRASVTALEAVREAADSGHAALVLKSHSFASPALAENLEQMVPGIRVFGGVCLDYPSGGLSVDAVEATLALGGKIVWLPTVHSTNDIHKRPVPEARHGGGIPVIDDRGAPLPVGRDICAMIREKDAVLATGHTTAAEHYAVIKEFASSGKVLVTHAGEALAGPRLSNEQCAELADLGATIEITALSCKDLFGVSGKEPAEVARMIRRVGPERITLSTDYGFTTAVPRPAAGLREFLESLWSEGISEAELQRMVSINPARLLGLNIG